MAEYKTALCWERCEQPFTDNRYSRAHVWKFDGGATVPASSSPHIVPLPYSDAAAVDPEEAFVASLSSCHMLCFLFEAARSGFRVDTYTDSAVGVLEKDALGRLAVTRVTLRPAAVFSGDRLPTHAEVHALHHEAHARCFLANSVRTDIRCEPVFPEPPPP